jgi:hypothetical protein
MTCSGNNQRTRGYSLAETTSFELPRDSLFSSMASHMHSVRVLPEDDGPPSIAGRYRLRKCERSLPLT